jgi:hypothetical protein
MERAEVLMLKLIEQYRKKEDPSVLLQTLQQIQDELSLSNIAVPQVKDRNKVSVVLPFRHKPVVSDDKPAEEERIVQVLQVDESEVEKELEVIKQSAELREEMVAKFRPPVQEVAEPEKEALPQLSQAIQFDPIEIEEIPTLATHIPPAPVVPDAPLQTKPVIIEPVPQPQQEAETVKELNEKFREPRKEVAQKLQDVPIKDLRKAIGINDRYLYINELFNADEAMFERSVKTLNQFSILPEAEFWMQRELRIKLGWKEDNPLVQQFIQLVRRRFS